MLVYQLRFLGRERCRSHTDLDRENKRIKANVIYSFAQKVIKTWRWGLALLSSSRAASLRFSMPTMCEEVDVASPVSV